MEKVIVEVMVPATLADAALMDEIAAKLPGLAVDPDYPPVEVPRGDGQARGASSDGGRVVVVRGQIAPGDKAALRAAAGVLGVWSDGPVLPFSDEDTAD